MTGNLKSKILTYYRENGFFPMHWDPYYAGVSSVVGSNTQKSVICESCMESMVESGMTGRLIWIDLFSGGEDYPCDQCEGSILEPGEDYPSRYCTLIGVEN